MGICLKLESHIDWKRKLVTLNIYWMDSPLTRYPIPKLYTYTHILPDPWRLCFCQPKQPHRGPVFPRSPRVFFKLCLVAKIKISQIISFLFICSWTREKYNQKEGNSRQKLLGSFAYTHLLTKEQAGLILSFQGSNTNFSSGALYIIH